MLKQLSAPYLESRRGEEKKKGSFEAKREKRCNPTNQALLPMLKLLAVCAGPVVMDAFITPASSHGHADGVLLCLSPHGPAGQRLASVLCFPCVEANKACFFFLSHNHTDPHSSNSTIDMLNQTLHRTPLTTTTTNVPHR